ncbi:hypothetical protein ACH47C_17120 [Streptomyces rishiriensis]|uniref:hypothetical protein n=1 Tax=Streptomyces rishiriensis TaxID=68264 RepID=UPI000D591437|nr:hypothetical protein [Streptomyces rishiriensis]
MTARHRRCGHGTGPLHPGDQKAVAEFTAMLTTRKRPAPWTGTGDIALRIAVDGQSAGADPVAPVLIRPDPETALTSTLHCARRRIGAVTLLGA